jgi:hypothetical protein
MGLHGLACWMGKYWSLDRDIAFLEIIPIAFSIFLCNESAMALWTYDICTALKWRSHTNNQ